MKEKFFETLEDSDNLEFYYKYIASRSINSARVGHTTTCYTKHLEINKFDYPFKISISKGDQFLLNFIDDFSTSSSCIWTVIFIYSSSFHLGY